MRLLFFLALLLFSVSSCKHKQTYHEKKKEIDAGHLSENNIYSAKEVGWTVQVPDGWQIITRKEKKVLSEKGKKSVEETLGENIDASELVELINFKKDMFNSFLSTMEPFDEKKYGSYDNQNTTIHELVKKTYASKNIYAEYELGALRIDGKMFDRFITKVYSPDKKNIIINQAMFSCLINGYDFSMVINYNNEKDKETLMNVIQSSKFSNLNTH